MNAKVNSYALIAIAITLTGCFGPKEIVKGANECPEPIPITANNELSADVELNLSQVNQVLKLNSTLGHKREKLYQLKVNFVQSTHIYNFYCEEHRKGVLSDQEYKELIIDIFSPKDISKSIGSSATVRKTLEDNLEKGINAFDEYRWLEAYDLLEPYVENKELEAIIRMAMMIEYDRHEGALLPKDRSNEFTREQLYQQGVKQITEPITDPWHKIFLLYALVNDKILLENGEIDTIRKNQILRWNKRLATNGNSGAQLALSYYYDKKYSNNDDEHDLFVYYMEQAAKNGDPVALMTMAADYISGDDIYERDVKTGIEILKRVSENSTGRIAGVAEVLLGIVYYKGNDENEGLKWINRAAASGLEYAQKMSSRLKRGESIEEVLEGVD